MAGTDFHDLNWRPPKSRLHDYNSGEQAGHRNIARTMLSFQPPSYSGAVGYCYSTTTGIELLERKRFGL